jgi:hypothetical protein
MRRDDMALTMMWCSGWSHVTLLSVLHGSVVAQSGRDVIVNENGLYSSSILYNNNLLRQVVGVGMAIETCPLHLHRRTCARACASRDIFKGLHQTWPSPSAYDTISITSQMQVNSVELGGALPIRSVQVYTLILKRLPTPSP